MPTFMTADRARDLLRRSMRPRPSHVTPELTAGLTALANEGIEAARGYAVEMIEQRAFALAGHGFTEAARLEKLREFNTGKRKEGDDGK